MAVLMRGWFIAMLILGAVVFLSLTTKTLLVTAEETDDTEQVCRWNDEAGEVVCQEKEIRELELPESDSIEKAKPSEESKDDDDSDSDGDGDDDSEGEGEGGAEEEEKDDEDWDLEESHEKEIEEIYYEIYEKYKAYPEEGEEWDIWKHGGKTDMYNELNCPQEFKDSSFENIHDTETWETFNRIYNEVIAGLDEPLKQESTIPPKFEKNGFQFPIEIKFSQDVGRGVYAKTDIPKGSLLYVSTNNGAFHSGQAFRNFMKSLPPKLACDVSIWSFVRWVSLESEVTEDHMICCDLDEGSFVNSADKDGDLNMALGNDDGELYMNASNEIQRSLWYGCKMKFWAAMDIKAGDEIRASYGDFAEQDGWMYLGL